MPSLRSSMILGLLVFPLCSCAKSEKYDLTRDDYQECVLGNFIDKQSEMGRSAINHAFSVCKSKRTELTQSAAEWTNAPTSQVRRIDRAVLLDLYRTMREELELPLPAYRIEIAHGVPKPMPSLHPAISDRYWRSLSSVRNGAFAQSGKRYGFTTREATVEDAVIGALALCDAVSKSPCEIVAVNADIVKEEH